jgi:hypothetical protein
VTPDRDAIPTGKTRRAAETTAALGGSAKLVGACSPASPAAVLGHLRVRGNWHRCARELWSGDEPATELGRAERGFFGSCGWA